MSDPDEDPDHFVSCIPAIEMRYLASSFTKRSSFLSTPVSPKATWHEQYTRRSPEVSTNERTFQVAIPT